MIWVGHSRNIYPSLSPVSVTSNLLLRSSGKYSAESDELLVWFPSSIHQYLSISPTTWLGCSARWNERSLSHFTFLPIGNLGMQTMALRLSTLLPKKKHQKTIISGFSNYHLGFFLLEKIKNNSQKTRKNTSVSEIFL